MQSLIAAMFDVMFRLICEQLEMVKIHVLPCYYLLLCAASLQHLQNALFQINHNGNGCCCLPCHVSLSRKQPGCVTVTWHSPITVSLSLESKKWGRGMSKPNCQVLWWRSSFHVFCVKLYAIKEAYRNNHQFLVASFFTCYQKSF